MKGTFFNKPLEWNIETIGETWQQGESIKGTLKVKNHSGENQSLENTGVGLAFADIKKVHTRAPNALKLELSADFPDSNLGPQEEKLLEFNFSLGPNSGITDKKSSFYLCFGKEYVEGQLQLKVEPKALYSKVVGLLDTFHRFKQKEVKTTKKGVEYKLLPPTSREMANIESMLLTFSMEEDDLLLKFDFHVKRLDTSSVTTKINKESVIIEKRLAPREYSLGRDMINQDQLLKNIELVLSDVKMKAVF